MIAFLIAVQSFLSALGTVVTQKALSNRPVGNDWQTFLSRTVHFTVLAAAFSASLFAFPDSVRDADPLVEGAWFSLAVAMIYVTYPLRRTAYLNEKISTLQPFVMAKGALTVIVSYLVLSETTGPITLACALLSIVILAFAGTDRKNFSFNRYSLMMLFSGVIQSFQILIVVRFIGLLGPAGFYFAETAAVLVLSFVLILARGQWGQSKALNRKYLGLQFAANVVALASILLTLFFYRDLWVVFTSLVSFLSLAFLYLLAYWFFRDKPRTKDLLAAVAVTVFIALGAYYR